MASGIRPPHKSPHSGVYQGRQPSPFRHRTPQPEGDIQAQEPFVSQIMRYLRRLRHTVPIPCGPDATYFGLVPEQVEKWFQKGLFSEEAPLPGRAGNLLHTMLYTFEAASASAPFNPLVSQNGVLHVSVEAQEDYVEAMRGVRGHERIFWTQVPQFVPLPRNSVKTPFWLSPDHPQFQPLVDWWIQATILQSKIEMAKACMGMLDSNVELARDLQQVWPEIMSFLSIRNAIRPVPTRRNDAQRQQLLHNGLQNYDLKAITDMLATATLLPEKPSAPLRAWVGFFVQEGD